MLHRYINLQRWSKFLLPIFGVLVLQLTACEKPDKKPVDGITRQLATYRAEHLDNLKYEISLTIPDSLSNPIRGKTTIRFQAKDTMDQLTLDFEPAKTNLNNVQYDQNKATYTVRNGHIIVKSDQSKISPGTHSLVLHYEAGEAPLNRNEDYLYSLFVPARASQALPVFDQPTLKGRFQLSLSIPSEWKAVSNSPVDTILDKESRKEYRFKETAPLPTYLFSFAAGKFQIEKAQRNGREMRMFHRISDSSKIARNREKIFDLHAQSLRWLARYTDISYPFEKFDFVLLPGFQYGGMEHPGAILYRASRVLLDQSATQQEKLNQASLIAHETAHMWFGDLVTMEWFNDAWTKEVFANFMAAKIVHPSFPDINHEQRFILEHFPPSYRIDRSLGTHPIRQDLKNLKNAGSIYGSLIYHKAPIVMNKLEKIMGAEKMQKGIQNYLEHYQWKNASWRDLVTVLDSLSTRNLKKWSHVWVEEAGRPLVKTRIRKSAPSSVSLQLSQLDPLNRNRVWPQYLTVEVQTDKNRQTQHLLFDEASQNLAYNQVSGSVNYVLPNSAGTGYGQFKLDSVSIPYFLQNTTEIASAEKRAIVWITLWDNYLEKRISTADFMQLLLTSLPQEKNPMNTEHLLSYLNKVYWRYATDSLRRSNARRIEKLLWTQIQQTDSSSMKSTYFKSYRNIATTDSALSNIYRVWSRKRDIAGLTFSTRDYTRMAAILAIHKYKNPKEILNEQKKRIENTDRRKRFKFIRPALSPNPDIRDKFFKELKKPEKRAHEPWVIDAVRYLHHPVRKDSARKYLYPSLKMLTEIKRTGDIFFPKSWLDATFSGHNTMEAALVVKSFLEVKESYPHFLKQKLLQSVDPLIRAVEMREDVDLTLEIPRSK